MAKQTINLGTGPNTGTGEPIRSAFGKVNENFTEVYDIAQGAFNYANTIVSDTQVDPTARNTSNAAFDKANSANDLAQAAFNYANTIVSDTQVDPVARETSNAAFNQANSANDLAQAAFDAANNAEGGSANTGDVKFLDNEIYTETGVLYLYSTGAGEGEFNRVEIEGDRFSAYVEDDIDLVAGANVEIVAGNNTNAKTWQLKYNGELIAPGAITSDNGEGYQTIIDPDGITAVYGGNTIYTIAKGPGGGSINTEEGKSFFITTDDNNNLWEFGTDGGLNIPGNIKAAVDINLSVVTRAAGDFISTTALNGGSPGFTFANYISGSGGTDYPDLANVQVGWGISGPGINPGATVTSVNTVDFGSGQLVRQINVPSDGSSGLFTAFDEYTFTDPVNRVITDSDWIFDANGNLTLPGNLSFSSACTSSEINFVPNSSGDGEGYSTIEIRPDTSLSENDQYLIIDPTDPRHIHIRAGGTQDDSNATLFLGGENSHFVVYSGENPAVAITANNNTWEFSVDGTIQFPDYSVQTTAFTSNPTLDYTTTNVLKVEEGVQESYSNIANATGTVVHDCANGQIFYHTTPASNWTANFTNLQLTNGYATSLTLVISQGATGYIANSVLIDNSVTTIKWQGNTVPTPNVNSIDVVSFSVIQTGGNPGDVIVLGQLSTFG